jgi:hypothetical protein
VVIRRSIAAAIALGALFTAIPAMAQVEKTVTSGIWSAFAGTHGDTPSCGVGAQLPDRSFAVSVQRDRPGVVRITVGTPGWDGEQVPPHTDISFEPSGALYGLTSAGSVGHFDYFDLDSARVRTWVHDFTAGSKMILSFPDEATWSFDLTGTSPTISAMLKCVTDNNMAGLPAPFALTAQPETPPQATALTPPAPAPTVVPATPTSSQAGTAVINLVCTWRSSGHEEVITINTDAHTWAENGQIIAPSRFTTKDGSVCEYPSIRVDPYQFSYTGMCDGKLAHSETINRYTGTAIHYYQGHEENQRDCKPGEKPRF